MAAVLPELWPHQKKAICSAANSTAPNSVIAHATGSGKSRTAWEIVRAYGKANPGIIMFWICERASVLRDMFRQAWVRSGLTVVNLVEKKDPDWSWKAKSAICWNRPVLICVNRAYLVSLDRYKAIPNKSVGLVVHDECHSGAEGTMLEFMAWLEKTQPASRVVGLSATPPPGANVISRFSIYDAVCAGVVLPVKLVWGRGLVRGDLGAKSCLALAEDHGLSKIIVWCGTIAHALATLRTWSIHARRWRLAIDTSAANADHPGYDEFRSDSGKSVLFCAAKHREGSDIPGLGMAVFVDGVPKRGASVFVQCVGRVLRRGDGSRKHGFVVDLSARDGLELCDRVGKYLCLPPGVHPWSQDTRVVDGRPVHTLTLATSRETASKSSDAAPQVSEGERTLEEAFVRPVPGERAYRERLEAELRMIRGKSLECHLERAVEVLKLAGDTVEHVTRGSCGSSLVCYLLGISHVDPIRHDISFARFLNEFRSSLPDIDFDFPHDRRNEIFMAIAHRWPGRVARISNHVHFHEKSALREALRRCGLKGGVPTSELKRYLESLGPAKLKEVKRCARSLDGSFNCYSLHCGGIVYYPEGVPEEQILESRRGHLLAQVKADKRVASKGGHFKIDVLSSRALAQLVHVTDQAGVTLSLENPPFTEKMRALFARGDNIGLTLAESPLSRGEHTAKKPGSVEEVAACMALIRPAARKSEIQIVYDDDAIRLIADRAGVSEAVADSIRRKLAKHDEEGIHMLRESMGEENAAALAKELGSISMYGFCKAHAMSYAQLVCWLAWCKTEHPKLFWEGALIHCQSFYKPWVHIWEAHRAGVSADRVRSKGSIFAQTRREKARREPMMVRLQKTWAWDPAQGFVPGCYTKRSPEGDVVEFRGVIACKRQLSEDAVAITIGTGDEYVDVTVHPNGLNGGSRLAQGVRSEEGEWKCVFKSC